MECNHDLKSEKCTIIIDKKKKLMVFPRVYMGICKECRKSFKFTKVNGEFVEN